MGFRHVKRIYEDESPVSEVEEKSPVEPKTTATKVASEEALDIEVELPEEEVLETPEVPEEPVEVKNALVEKPSKPKTPKKVAKKTTAKKSSARKKTTKKAV